MEINKVAVIGAGVMGAGIAAHVANAGVPVVLLDIVPEGADNRNVIAESAVQKMLKTEPAAFMHKKNAKLVTTGNIDDHMELLADCDWIIEAVIERLDIKQALYKKIDAVRKPDALVSSNTSTIPLDHLVEGLSGPFAENFLITHFFNPPRYMRLLEIVRGAKTRADAVPTVRDFCDRRLGKGVVDCKDTPGFIANRIGIYWIQTAILEAMRMGVTVEEADAVLSRPVGIPKTGVFGLSDLVGIDLMPHLMTSMKSTLPPSDPFHTVAEIPKLIERMIADGYTGRKGKGGFYRINKAGGQKVKEAIDLQSGEYRVAEKPRLDSVDAAKGGLRALVEHADLGGRYAWQVLSKVLGYAAGLVPEINDDIHAVDEAMRLGYAWKYGPFELIDQLGGAWFADRLRTDGHVVPAILEVAGDKSFYRVNNGVLQYLTLTGDYRDVPRAEGVTLLADIKRRSEPLAKNGSASLWDIGDGVVCLEFTSKMNSLDPQILAMIRTAIELIPAKGYKALVIHNEGSNFSVGANLGLVLYAANLAMWAETEAMVKEGQDAYKALKYAPFPVVGAPTGMALGGGCEILLHCDAVQAHAETYMGLVEVGVGVIPGWGGCKEMLTRWVTNKRRPGGPMPPVIKVFETISVASVAKSAAEAKDYLFLRHDDGITMNRDRLLVDAKARALALAADYTPPEPVEISLPGPTAKTAMEMAVDGFVKLGKATRHDVVVSAALADCLSGGDTDVTESLTEDDLLALERRHFMRLLRHPDTLARMEHMLTTGKPLRN
ncbi:MAG: 3-hydroxyacyl-CoA dehydrogenase/enoyl-CoA hydratase family protein [Proteobacteria bacterium]|nr:MAG: 3-hydroxyacyl-CoA dehydrogenase/enoyl-CoA hydratase family protein [Pseudomonadota bacterium]QKK11440.1 MAG: 3-hydroxyacyl-CoA dehydrogenase/enoyl-CoA hydratase family protein [Pseudomonadota bacterium]